LHVGQVDLDQLLAGGEMLFDECPSPALVASAYGRGTHDQT